MPTPAPRQVKKETTPSSANGARFSLHRILDAARQEATGSKTSNYLITTIATGILYVAVSLLVIKVTPFEFLITMWILLSFVFAVTFSPLRYGMEEFLRQLIPGFDYDSHQLIKRLNIISYSSLTLSDLSRLFFEEFALSFSVPESAFIFLNGRNYLVKTSDHFTNLHSLTKEEIDLLFQHLSRQEVSAKSLHHPPADHILKAYHIRVVTPLACAGQLVGILVIGTKDNQKAFTTKDLKVLNAIAPKIGYAIKNARAYERVKHRNDTLITELKSSNEQIRLANRQLRRDDKLKDEFVYIATHELKNPVTAMKGFLSLIREGTYGKVPPKLQSPLTQIESSNQQLIALLNNLLNIARAEAQKLVIKTQPVTICKVIEEVMHDVQPLAEQKHLTLTHACKNPAITVMADRERLREIINNLVTNSIKYSESGTIEVTHTVEQDKLITHIQDQGVGINAVDQTKIFTRFFRVEEEAAKGIPGSGLGLFICKQLLEKMDGSISFRSEPGVGSTFSFALPLAHTYTLKTG